VQRVVDLVSDAGDELANGRQPLAVHQLIAQREVLGHVALDANEVRDAAGGIAQSRDRARRRKRRSVLPFAAQRPAPHALGDDLRRDVAADVVHP